MFAEKIITTFEKEEWESALDKLLKGDFAFINQETDISRAVGELSIGHSIDPYEAAILYHSKKNG